MRKRIISFTIVIVLMLSLLMTGCSEGEILKMAGIKQKWIASDIAGTVTAETDVRLQDDYAAAVNKDWILAHSDGRGASTMLEVLTNVLKKKRTLLEDTTVTGKGIEEVRKYGALLEDMETRDRLGWEPVKKYIDGIEAIKDTESLYAWICDPAMNPLGAAPLVIGQSGQSYTDPTAYMTLLEHGGLCLQDDLYFDLNDEALMQVEMLNEVLFSQKDSGETISHVVLMGTGEPLDNFDNVMRFLRLLNHPDVFNLSLRHVSLSTCGIIERFDDLALQDLQLTLAVSLHAPDDETRSRLMPANRGRGVDALMKACRDYTEKTGRRVSFEYAMIDGVNDTLPHAKLLAERARSVGAHVNLIPLNHVEESRYGPSTQGHMKAFIKVLEDSVVNYTVRRRLGGDIDASCGQLRRKFEKSREK